MPGSPRYTISRGSPAIAASRQSSSTASSRARPTSPLRTRSLLPLARTTCDSSTNEYAAGVVRRMPPKLRRRRFCEATPNRESLGRRDAHQMEAPTMHKKLIAVVGATGAQGGGLARAILDDPDGRFACRALARDPSSPTARALAGRGAEVVRADLDHEGTLRAAFEGGNGAYCMTTSSSTSLLAKKPNRPRTWLGLRRRPPSAMPSGPPRRTAATGCRHTAAVCLRNPTGFRCRTGTARRAAAWRVPVWRL